MVSSKVKLFILTVGAALGLTTFAVNPTQAATLGLKFLDSSGNESQGTLTANSLSENELEQFGGRGDSGIIIGQIRNWLYVRSFEATITRFSWNSSYANFWDPESNRLKYIAFTAYGEAYILDQGLFGSQDDLNNPALVLGEDSIYRVLSSGENIEGNWTITRLSETSSQTSGAVPEAPTILGSLTAITMLTLFKRVISKKIKS